MSRTKRKPRPKMYNDWKNAPVNKDGTTRDGAPQHVSGRCENHGGCSYCEGGRTHKNKRRKPLEE